MTASVTYPWPPLVTRTGEQLPEGVRVLTGTLVVPPDLPPGVLAHMEQRFRHVLWPPCKGYKRHSREFEWEDGGRLLHYRIVDFPARGQTVGEEP